MSEQSQERTEQATPKRRQDARRKGTVAKSTDLTSSLVLLALALMLPLLATTLGFGLLEAMRIGLNPQTLSLNASDLLRHVSSVLQPLFSGLIPIVAIGLVVGLAANFMQVGFHASAEPLNPQFKRINPIEGFKRVISRRAAFEFAKTLAKFVLIGYIAWSEVASRWEAMLGLSALTPSAGVAWVAGLLSAILLKVAFAWIALGALDYWFQRKQTEKQLMMTKEELKREMKESETCPELRAEMQRRRRRLARQRMMANVKHADAVITNPTEYAVAIRYDAKKMAAPIVLAKGRHLAAERIRDEAKKHRVPIVPNPPLARSLYSEVEVGEAIPTALFQAVAEVLAYVFRQKRGR